MSLFTTNKHFLTRITQEFVDREKERGAPPLHTLSPGEARKFLVDVQSGEVKKCPALIEDAEWQGGPIGKVNIRIVKPEGSRDRLPCILYMHGGGWVMGDATTHDRLIRLLANEVGAAVVFIDYARSPEAHYPVALEQCYAALEYAEENATSLGFDPDGFVVAGDSAGGNLATVLTMLAKERGGPCILSQILFYPVTDADFYNRSYKEFFNGPYLTRRMMENFWDAYLPEPKRRKEHYASPLQAADAELAGLPPALIITAENDVLREEGEQYAHRLDAAGTPTSCVRVLGTIHDFVMLNGLADSTPAHTAVNLAVATIKKAFQATFPESTVARAAVHEPAMA